MHGASLLRLPYRDTPLIEDVSTVDVFVPARNVHCKTLQCLKSLSSAMYTGFSTYVIDNNSTPSMEETILESGLSNVTHIRNPRNMSFSKCNNQAASISSGTYILLLNNDCYIRPECISRMRGAFEVDSKIAIVGARLIYPDEKIQHAGVIFHEGRMPYHYARGAKADNADANLRGEYPAVTGACMMIRRDVWNLVGQLDEDYTPGGFEDIDLCCKVRDKGYAVWYEPAAVAIHEESASYFSTPELKRVRQEADLVNWHTFQDKWFRRYVNFNTMKPVETFTNMRPKDGLLII